MWQEAAALRDFNPTFVRFGSGADKLRRLGYVRFAPESGQTGEGSTCPLCAKSGHTHLQQKVLLFDHLVGAQQESPGSSGRAPFGGQVRSFPAGSVSECSSI